MKNKEILARLNTPVFGGLIVFVLAVLVTWGSGFVFHPSPGCGDFPDALCEGGWPLAFHRVGGIMGVDQWLWFNLILDFLLWFLILAAGCWVIKKLKRAM